MSRDTPAHARPAGESGAGPNGTSRPTSPVAQALRDLMPPRHGSTFWTDLDERLADEPQLRLAPRSAIRPITQPPPVIDDRNLAGSLKGDRPPPKRSSRRTILAVAAAVLIVLVGVAALQGPDDDEDTTSTDATTETTAAPATTEGDAPPETEAPPTTAPGTIAADEPLHPGGVGPLTIGARLGDLQAAGAAIQVDAATYEGSGGSCYDAKVAGALDLTLRFRAPDGESRADDPTEGVLTSISIQRELPTTRRTDVGLGVGSPVTDLLGYYGENVDERAHPFLSGGSIYRAAAADGKGTAFFTDGLAVVRVSVGEMDSIRFVNQCG